MKAFCVCVCAAILTGCGNSKPAATVAPAPTKEPVWTMDVKEVGNSTIQGMSIIYKKTVVQNSDAQSGAAKGAGIGFSAAWLLGGPVVLAAAAGGAIGSHAGSKDNTTEERAELSSCSFHVIVDKLALSFTQAAGTFFRGYPQTLEKCVTLTDGMPTKVLLVQNYKDGVPANSFYLWEIGTIRGPLF